MDKIKVKKPRAGTWDPDFQELKYYRVTEGSIALNHHHHDSDITAAELIAALRQFDPKATIYVEVDDEECESIRLSTVEVRPFTDHEKTKYQKEQERQQANEAKTKAFLDGIRAKRAAEAVQEQQ